MIKFNDRCREIRKSKGYTQKQVALSINMSERNYQEWEYGRAKPGLDSLLILAKFFDVSLDYLVGNSDNPEVNR